MSIQEKQKLTDKQLMILNSEMEKHKKSTAVAYLLWVFLGSLGIHKFYIGKSGWGAVNLLIGVVGWITAFTGGLAALANDVESTYKLGAIGLLCFFLLVIMLFIDLFTIPRQIKNKYEAEEKRVISDLLMTESTVHN